MKKILIIALSLILVSTLLCGCGLSQGKIVYENIGVFDLSDSNTENFSINVTSKNEGKVTKLMIGPNNIDYGYVYKKGILTIDNEVMKKMTAGEKKLRVYFGSEFDDTKTILLVTKTIKTAADFQSISDNLYGSYILVNDIDCSSITNFLPFGKNSGIEGDPNNIFFHGILEGNGYVISNINIDYHNLEDETYYNQGQVMGVFTNIGTAGIIRNTIFKNIRVSSKAIGGAICGVNEGLIENCGVIDSYITQDCSFDTNCNVGVVVGIVSGGGNVSYCYAANSAAISKGGYARVKDTDGVTDIYWACTVSISNQFAFCGKTWGLINNCVAQNQGVLPSGYTDAKVVISYDKTVDPVLLVEKAVTSEYLALNEFVRLDDGNNKDDVNSGVKKDCLLLDNNAMKVAQYYLTAGFNTTIWDIIDGSYPMVKNQFTI
jgi:hypothetical protein